MINLENIKSEKCQPPPPPTPYFKKTCPCTILPPPFLIFQIPPLLGYSKFTSPSFKKEGGGRAMVGITLVDIRQNWLNWFHFLFLDRGLLTILIDCMIFLSTF